jgi:hypothetical protein
MGFLFWRPGPVFCVFVQANMVGPCFFGGCLDLFSETRFDLTSPTSSTPGDIGKSFVAVWCGVVVVRLALLVVCGVPAICLSSNFEERFRNTHISAVAVKPNMLVTLRPHSNQQISCYIYFSINCFHCTSTGAVVKQPAKGCWDACIQCSTDIDNYEVSVNNKSMSPLQKANFLASAVCGARGFCC